ncbi:MAG TPA: hypothetical protein VFR31_13475 [Thermoanaerobaculia bacterium]|nr:hypothetical protein [Thermoanaerobaculia bacterium]
MSQPVASVTSSFSAINGNDNNSSLNFQFLQLPASGNVTVNIENNPNAGSISFTLWHVKGGMPDQKVKSGLTNGSTISISGNLEMGANYYVGDPSNAGNQNFVATFLA